MAFVFRQDGSRSVDGVSFIMKAHFPRLSQAVSAVQAIRQFESSGIVPGDSTGRWRRDRTSERSLEKTRGRTDIEHNQGDFGDSGRLRGHCGHWQESSFCTFCCLPSQSHFSLIARTTSLVSSDYSFAQVVGCTGKCSL